MSIFKNWVTSDAVLRQMITNYNIKISADLNVNSINFDIFDLEFLARIIPPEDKPLFSKKLLEFETDIFVKTGFMDELINKYCYSPMDHYTIFNIQSDIDKFLKTRECVTGTPIHQEFLAKYLQVNPFIGVVHIDTSKI